MKLTKGVITREQAIALAPEYVGFIADRTCLSDEFDIVLEKFEKLRRGQQVLTYCDGQFVRAKVSSINHNDIRAVDGPIVRVSNGEYSWRVDGDRYAWPLE